MQIRKGNIRAPRGIELSCKGWQQEAVLRMLMNNLDPDVAERPEALVVYGATGKAARTWEDYDVIVKILKELGDDETLVVQSGRPVGVFKTFADAPRVLLVCGFLVPGYDSRGEFRELQQKGLTMSGGGTAGSWIYIGAQGLIQGTYETLATAARESMHCDSLKGKLVLTSGLGSAGRNQAPGISMNEGVGIIVEVDKTKIERSMRPDIRFLDVWTDNLDEALKTAKEALHKGTSLSIGLLGNAADIYPEFVKRDIIPDIVTDQTAAHDELYGYIPAGFSLEEGVKLRRTNPESYIKRSYDSIVKHVQAMNEMQKRGAVVFEYGNSIRKQAENGGLKDAYCFPGFVDAYIRPAFCQGMGSFRWVALSGDPEDIYKLDKTVITLFPRLERWIKMAQQRIPFQGLPARICWLAHGERTQAGLHFNELVRNHEVKAPIVIGRGHLDPGAGASPDEYTAGMKDGSDLIGDWPILKGLLNVASGASWVSIHSSPGKFSSGMVVVADGTEKAKERLENSLTADTGLGVVSLANAGYELAIQTIKREPFARYLSYKSSGS